MKKLCSVVNIRNKSSVLTSEEAVSVKLVSKNKDYYFEIIPLYFNFKMAIVPDLRQLYFRQLFIV